MAERFLSEQECKLLSDILRRNEKEDDVTSPEIKSVVWEGSRECGVAPGTCSVISWQERNDLEA